MNIYNLILILRHEQCKKLGSVDNRFFYCHVGFGGAPLDWLTVLLKHLNLSRSIVVAVFVASASQYLGARYFPGYVESAPKGWGFSIFMAFALTGTLVIFWTAAAIWETITRMTKYVARSLGARSLSDEEVQLLVAMAHDPNRPLDIDDVDFKNAPLRKLEMLQIMRSLCQKGLVRHNPFASSLYSTTEVGQQRALVLLKKKVSD